MEIKERQVELHDGSARCIVWVPIADARLGGSVTLLGRRWTIAIVYRTVKVEDPEKKFATYRTEDDR